MANLVSVGSSVPSNGNAPFEVNVTDTPVRLAAFGINVPNSPNRVFLNATIGVQATILNPTLVFQVVRNNSEVIATIREQVIATLNQIQNVSFNAVDTNAPPGYHGYSVTVAVEGLLADAVVTGPVIFSGESYTF
ncbi:hypothetical protein [Paucisalibacillus sp. EB02]|uniref:hypothetical protein n=1 Tax=Paucisalibacillus sp. EB02 TaxID=1347087 RepID=UPI0004B611D9|nr:hypothetical protein [Paucisalibacillus sp. EB02]